MPIFEELLPSIWWKWQESVLRKERVSHLQSLTKGMVHDFRNGLAPVLGYIELLQSTPGLMDNPDQVRFFINSLFSAARDVQKSLNHLRDFYHPVPRSIPVYPTVARDVLTLVAESVFSKQLSRCICDLTPETRIWIKPEVLQSIFHELLENACYAMQEPEQRVRVSLAEAAKLKPFKGRKPLIWGDVPDESWVFVIEDDGIGSDESTLRYCVEPFFTGSVGRKSGVGLARVWGVLELHGAALAITSVPGEGTRVELHFPAKYFGENYPQPGGRDAFVNRLKGTGLTDQEFAQVETMLGRKISRVPSIVDLFQDGVSEGCSCWVSGVPFPKELLVGLDETLPSLNHRKMFILIRAGENDRPSDSQRILYWHSIEELVEILQGLEF